jgi:hypothetical protein
MRFGNEAEVGMSKASLDEVDQRPVVGAKPTFHSSSQVEYRELKPLQGPRNVAPLGEKEVGI